jgi:hypothetical protein
MAKLLLRGLMRGVQTRTEDDMTDDARRAVFEQGARLLREEGGVVDETPQARSPDVPPGKAMLDELTRDPDACRYYTGEVDMESIEALLSYLNHTGAFSRARLLRRDVKRLWGGSHDSEAEPAGIQRDEEEEEAQGSNDDVELTSLLVGGAGEEETCGGQAREDASVDGDGDAGLRESSQYGHGGARRGAGRKPILSLRGQFVFFLCVLRRLASCFRVATDLFNISEATGYRYFATWAMNVGYFTQKQQGYPSGRTLADNVPARSRARLRLDRDCAVVLSDCTERKTQRVSTSSARDNVLFSDYKRKKVCCPVFLGLSWQLVVGVFPRW